MIAAKSGSHKVVNVLLKAGADPGLQDEDGNTALMIAVKNSQIKLVKI